MAALTAAKTPDSTAARKPKAARKPVARKNGPAGKTRKEAEGTIRSKADLIRKVAGIIEAKGERPRPTEIARILQQEGVSVAPAQVSTTLKAAGYRPLRKRRKGKKTTEGIAAKKTVGSSQSGQVSMDDLLAAKSVSGAFGGTDKAIAALQALKRLES